MTYDPPITTNDAQFELHLRTAQEQEIKLAKVAAQRDVSLAVQRTRQLADRRDFVTQVLIGLAVFTLAVLFMLGVWFGVNGAGKSEQDKAREADIAKVCIQAGKEWQNGKCEK